MKEPIVYQLNKVLEPPSGFSSERQLRVKMLGLMSSLKENTKKVARLKQTKKEVLDVYDSEISSSETALEKCSSELKTMISCMGEFKKESGVIELDVFPHLGVFRVENKTTTFDFTDDEAKAQWLKKDEFIRVRPEEKFIDKNALNKHLKQFDIKDDRLIDSSGKLVPGIKVIQKQDGKFVPRKEVKNV